MLDRVLGESMQKPAGRRRMMPGTCRVLIAARAGVCHSKNFKSCSRRPVKIHFDGVSSSAESGIGLSNPPTGKSVPACPVVYACACPLALENYRYSGGWARRWSQLRLFVVHPESGEGVRMPKSHQTRRQCCGRWLSARALSFASELKDKNPITSIIRSFRIRSGLGPSGIESGRRNNRGILWGKRARPQVQAHRIVYGLGTVRLRYLKTAGRTSGAMLLIQRRQEGCTMGTYR
ncbi:hypothetical protein OOU_Y34scaffold00494g3 [Pyricularia oryzae Y34]|uniref:Uncharacterized protein n=1 Tax=Pyricularia oryzae (strain Y34) TaxID=1143189 RepID=A0AA97PM68_PYRO3|nr:hypothetical protein OOU_Y34scaffold00494g3 [Pyricularia oryzae Y34]